MNDFLENRSGNPYDGPYDGPHDGGFGGSAGGDSEAVRLLREIAEAQRQTLEAQRQCQETQRKSLRAARVALALWAALLLCAALAVPPVLRTIRQAEASLNAVTSLARNMESVTGDAGQAVAQISEVLSALNNGENLLSGDKLADGIRNFQDGMDAFRTAMAKLNAIDFDALNQAVRDLSGMAAPLRQFAGLLGG